MFNKSIITLKKTGLLVAAFLVLFSCKEDPVPLTFKDHTLVKNVQALVQNGYQKAEEESAGAKNIKQVLENLLANGIHMGDTRHKHLTLGKAIAGFDQDYKSFIEDFSDSTQAWE